MELKQFNLLIEKSVQFEVPCQLPSFSCNTWKGRIVDEDNSLNDRSYQALCQKYVYVSM